MFLITYITSYVEKIKIELFSENYLLNTMPLSPIFLCATKQYFKINLNNACPSERTNIICTKPFQLFTNKHKKLYLIFLLVTSSSRHALSSITIILVCPPFPNFSATHSRQLNSKREMIFKNFQFHGSLLLF